MRQDPLDPDDALTIDGADLLAEIRELTELRELGELTNSATDEPAHTQPTQRRWKPPASSTEDSVDAAGVDRSMSQPQLIAIVLACLLGLGAAIATWRGAEQPAHQPTSVSATP